MERATSKNLDLIGLGLLSIGLFVPVFAAPIVGQINLLSNGYMVVAMAMIALMGVTVFLMTKDGLAGAVSTGGALAANDPIGPRRQLSLIVKSMRFDAVAFVFLLGACSGGSGVEADKERHLKIAEAGGPYISDVVRYESIGQKSLKRGQKYRITDQGRDHSPFYLIADITQFVGGKKGNVFQGTLIYVEDGLAEYDCNEFMSDRKLSESDEDTPVVSCNFKFLGTMPVIQGAVVEKAE
jgi:hypothetical protein